MPVSAEMRPTRLAGMPVLRQFETALGPTPSFWARTEAPPTASQAMSSGSGLVLLMRDNYSLAEISATVKCVQALKSLSAAGALAFAPMEHETNTREIEFYEDLAWRLKMAIEELPHPKGEIAEKIGVSQQRLSNWITNQNKPDWFGVAKLCSRYGISPDWLLLGEIRGLPKWLGDRLELVAAERQAVKQVQARLEVGTDQPSSAPPKQRDRKTIRNKART